MLSLLAPTDWIAVAIEIELNVRNNGQFLARLRSKEARMGIVGLDEMDRPQFVGLQAQNILPGAA